MKYDPKDYDQHVAQSADWTRACLIKVFSGSMQCALLSRPDRRSAYPSHEDLEEWLKLTKFEPTIEIYGSGYYEIITFRDPEMLTLLKMAFNVPE